MLLVRARSDIIRRDLRSMKYSQTRRGFLRVAGMGLPLAIPSLAQPASGRAGAAPSLSRQLARWVAGLRYEDLPAAVVDRTKGLTLHGLASALQGYQLP